MNAWAQSLQLLIEHGHSLPDLMNYTWGQFVAFSKALQERQQQQRREYFTLSFIASRGSEESVKQCLKSME